MLDVIKVKANDDFTLEITFENNEMVLFDMKPYLSKGIFMTLNDINEFKKIGIRHGVVAWANGLDISSDTVYIEGEKIAKKAV